MIYSMDSSFRLPRKLGSSAGDNPSQQCGGGNNQEAPIGQLGNDSLDDVFTRWVDLMIYYRCLSGHFHREARPESPLSHRSYACRALSYLRTTRVSDKMSTLAPLGHHKRSPEPHPLTHISHFRRRYGCIGYTQWSRWSRTAPAVQADTPSLADP